MSGYSTVSHQGKTIVILDFSNTWPAEAILAMAEAQQKIAALPLNSALILTDVANTIFTSESINALKAFVSKNKPYVKASAVVGALGARAVLLQSVSTLNGRGNQSL
jgi:hypothetical protein